MFASLIVVLAEGPTLGDPMTDTVWKFLAGAGVSAVIAFFLLRFFLAEYARLVARVTELEEKRSDAEARRAAAEQSRADQAQVLAGQVREALSQTNAVVSRFIDLVDARCGVKPGPRASGAHAAPGGGQ